MNEDTDTVTIRIPKSLKKTLEDRSRKKELSLNNLINKILINNVFWSDHLKELGWMYFHPSIVREIFISLDGSDIEKIVKKNKKDILNGIKFLYEEITLDKIVKFMQSWLDSANMPYRHIQKDRTHRFIVTHTLGKNWSMFATRIIQEIVTDAGLETNNVHFSEDQYSFDISNKN